MSKFDYSSIDGNRPATAKQLNGVASRFPQLYLAKNPSQDSYMSFRMFQAILLNKYSETNTQMTHAEVQKYFKAKTIPKDIVAKIKTKPTASTPKRAKSPAKSSQKTDLEKTVAAQAKQIEDLTKAVNILLTKLQ